MDGKFWIEAAGYLGSALVVVSMLMSSVVRLRVINMIGSIIFACYALIIRSYPTALMNAFLVGINIYHLLRLRNTQKNYDLVPLDPVEGYVGYFLSRYGEDIRVWFPEFRQEAANVAYLVCCEGRPAGLFLGCARGDSLDILLDYTTPAYRDTSVGRCLYQMLSEAGYRKLIFRGNAPGHTAYMEKVGFRFEGDAYVKTL